MGRILDWLVGWMWTCPGQAVAVAIVISLAFYGAIGYVLVHFITKYW